MSGGGSKSTETQVQTTSNQPYKAAQPLYNKAMKDALGLYNKGELVNPSTMSTVVPFDQRTTQGMNALEAQANQNMGGAGLSGQMQSVIDSGGLTGTQQGALGTFSDFATGGTDPSFAQQNLSEIASGGLLSGGDPYFEDVLNRASEDARFAADRTAAGVGRYGSADHYGNVARNVGNIQMQARSDQYNRERAAQMAANQMLDQNRLADAGNMLQGASQMFNAGQTAFGNIPTAFQNMQAPAQALTGIGGAYEDLAARELNDELRLDQQERNKQLAGIQGLLGVASGAGGYGTSTATAQTPRQNNTWSNIGGGLLGGASLLSALSGY